MKTQYLHCFYLITEIESLFILPAWSFNPLEAFNMPARIHTVYFHLIEYSKNIDEIYLMSYADFYMMMGTRRSIIY